jgi:hypothetical protein
MTSVPEAVATGSQFSAQTRRHAYRPVAARYCAHCYQKPRLASAFGKYLMSDTRELHIAPGTAAGGCLVQAFNLAADELLSSQDCLSFGPLLPLHHPDQWRRLRESYLRTLYLDNPEFSFGAFHRDLLSNARTLARADEIIVWIGTGLAEQLLLAWIPQFLRLLEIDLQKLRVIQFEHDPTSGEEVQSVGILDPEKLKSHPRAGALDPIALATLDHAWSAVTARDPTALIALVAAEPAALPFLHRSLRWLLWRFPDADSGLGYLDRLLLELVVEVGPTAVKVIGYAIARSIDGLDWVGDAYLFARLRRMADRSLPQPLLSITGDGINLRGTEFQITRSGMAVLSGEANFVNLNGIDDWIGGTHLDSSTGKIWVQRNGLPFQFTTP